jgi:chromosome segregation ATPase
MSDAKKAKAIAEETGATAEGELERTNKEIADDQKKLKELQHECMTKAEEHEMEQKERGEELGALAAAKKVLNEKTGAAADRTYGTDEPAAFLQLRTKTRMRSRAALRQVENRVVTLLQSLAQETQVRALSQLAVHIRSEMLTSADPFAKVKGMVQEMIEKLVAEAQEEADHKAFCDKEMSETKAKMEDKQEEVDDLTTKIDKSVAKVAKLKEEIATLEKELMKIAEEQKVATEMRESEKAAWEAAKADFESGLEGVQMALQVLRDYYAEKEEPEALLQSDQLADEMSLAQSTTQKSSGAASGIIGMLEVAESDFSKMLAEGSANEDQAVKEYEAMTEDNKVTTAAKETEVKYKQKDSKETKAYIEETKADLETSHTELSAIMEYWEKLQPQCVAKPEPYEERKKRREKEIAGLKEALTILEEESATSFLAVRARY